jgi:hypothetical protein
MNKPAFTGKNQLAFVTGSCYIFLSAKMQFINAVLKTGRAIILACGEGLTLMWIFHTKGLIPIAGGRLSIRASGLLAPLPQIHRAIIAVHAPPRGAFFIFKGGPVC